MCLLRFMEMDCTILMSWAKIFPASVTDETVVGRSSPVVGNVCTSLPRVEFCGGPTTG